MNTAAPDARSGVRRSPLVRIGGERIFRKREGLDYTVPDGFAGSILNLEPGTEYECRFRLTDPDGVQGKAEYAVTVKTRSEPQAYAGGRTLHVYPPGYEGDRLEPNFPASWRPITAPGSVIGTWCGSIAPNRVTRSSCMRDCINRTA